MFFSTVNSGSLHAVAPLLLANGPRYLPACELRILNANDIPTASSRRRFSHRRGADQSGGHGALCIGRRAFGVGATRYYRRTLLPFSGERVWDRVAPSRWTSG